MKIRAGEGKAGLPGRNGGVRANEKTKEEKNEINERMFIGARPFVRLIRQIRFFRFPPFFRTAR